MGDTKLVTKIKEIVRSIIITRLSMWDDFDWEGFIERKTKEIIKAVVDNEKQYK